MAEAASLAHTLTVNGIGGEWNMARGVSYPVLPHFNASLGQKAPKWRVITSFKWGGRDKNAHWLGKVLNGMAFAFNKLLVFKCTFGHWRP